MSKTAAEQGMGGNYIASCVHCQMTLLVSGTGEA